MATENNTTETVSKPTRKGRDYWRMLRDEYGKIDVRVLESGRIVPLGVIVPYGIGTLHAWFSPKGTGVAPSFASARQMVLECVAEWRRECSRERKERRRKLRSAKAGA